MMQFFVISAAVAIGLSAQTLTVVHSFDNTDGANPFAGVIQAKDGNFYGTTYGGGTNLSGTVFQLTPGGTLNVLYNFCSQTNCTDGALPVGNLIQAKDLNLYGTTGYGGENNRGEIFRITTTGTLTVLYSFCNQTSCTDGALPYAGLILASDGNFYGTTRFGGANSWGEVFQYGGTGNPVVIYSFCPQSGCTDGARPNAALVQAGNDLYGTTLEGGTNGDGTVFHITTAGALNTLYSFCSQTSCTDGSSPIAPLIQASNGDLYGTTQQGGANNNNGTVFQITTAGALTTLYSFCSQTSCSDGQGPTAGLVQATDGNLYGSTNAGGNGYGTIFKITTGGLLTSLYAFPNSLYGQEPYPAMIQTSGGEFYGTTFIGGAHGYGEVFSFAAQTAVPNVVGLTQAAATTAIMNAGLVVGTVTSQSSANVPAGDVISQDPVAATEVNLGSSVNLVISSGSATNVSSQVQVSNTGFSLNRVTGKWSATMSVKNISATAIAAPIQVVLTNLSSNATMVNNTGMSGGSPYITVLTSGSLAPGGTVKVSIQFTNSNGGFITFTPVTYTGQL